MECQIVNFHQEIPRKKKENEIKLIRKKRITFGNEYRIVLNIQNI